MLQLIGGATLAVQTVVLGASLFQKAKKQQRAPQQDERPDAGHIWLAICVNSP